MIFEMKNRAGKRLRFASLAASANVRTTDVTESPVSTPNTLCISEEVADSRSVDPYVVAPLLLSAYNIAFPYR